MMTKEALPRFSKADLQPSVHPWNSMSPRLVLTDVESVSEVLKLLLESLKTPF